MGRCCPYGTIAGNEAIGRSVQRFMFLYRKATPRETTNAMTGAELYRQWLAV